MNSFTPAPWEPLPGVPLDVPSPDMKPTIKPHGFPPSSIFASDTAPSAHKLPRKMHGVFSDNKAGDETIKAIPTEYNGYIFRSRLEARWAVFFDAMRIEYQYEMEGYEGLDDVWYLPDFYLPTEGVHVEVKPTDKKLRKDWRKILAAIDWDATPVSKGLLILGDIPNPNDVGRGSVPMFSFLYCDKGVMADKAAFFYKWYGKRLFVGSENIVKELFSLPTYRDLIGGYYDGVEMPPYVTTRYVMATREKLIDKASDRLRDAYKIARQSRFEHGETPTKESVQGRMRR